MKKTLFLLLGCLFILGQTCSAISLADGYQTAKGGFADGTGKSHVHVTTLPSKVYGITVTAIIAGGWAQLIETGGDTTDETGQLMVSKGTVKADIRVAVANDTIHVSFEDGISCGKQLLLDCGGAQAIVAYRE